MKSYTITATTKANRTVYFHAVTVEAASAAEAKRQGAELITSITGGRHAFSVSTSTAASSTERAQWIADRYSVSLEAVMQAASRPNGIDMYGTVFPVIEEPETAEEAEAVTDPEHEQAEAEEPEADTVAEKVIKSARRDAAEILRVIGYSADQMQDAARIVATIMATAESTSNVDQLFSLARRAADLANLAGEANSKAQRDAAPAAEMVHKARRTAAAYRAAATRAGYTTKSVARRDAAEQAMEIVSNAYRLANDQRSAGNRAFNAAIDDARKVIRTAKSAAAVEKAREILARYPETSAEDVTEAVTRELDTRSKGIDAAAAEWRRYRVSNRTIAEDATTAAFTQRDEEQSTEDADAAAAFAAEARAAAHRAEAAAIAYADRADETTDAAEAADFADRAKHAADDAAEAARSATRWANAAAVTAAAEHASAYMRHADAASADDAAEAASSAEDAAACAEHAARRAARRAADLAEQAAEEPEPAAIYQRYELEEYIGCEFVDDYDLETIEQEATAYDPKIGHRVWTAFGDDLAAICQRHEI